MNRPPAPHPLDFDWRYDKPTTRALVALVQDAEPVLAIGVPTVARLLDADGIDVTLVDRQPSQGVRRHVAVDAVEFIPDRRYCTAIVDPPWYPTYLEDWTEAAARAVGVGGTILISVWPDVTRPTATFEITSALNKFSKWADVERNVERVTYMTPGFERVAAELRGETELSRSPRFGELIRLRVLAIPESISRRKPEVEWTRFILDDYQLAIKRSARSGPLSIHPLPVASGWHWPFVSARAPAIGEIDIWSSEGEVAALGSQDGAIDVLKRALATHDRAAFELALAHLPALLTWRIPRPPYWRSIEWRHRQ